MTKPRLVLASGSPRRLELLARVEPDFEVVTSGAEESEDEQPERELPLPALPAPYRIPAEANPTLWAWRKAFAVAQASGVPDRDTLVLGADTIVLLEDRVLGKPHTPERAAEMLRELGGREHAVITGWAILLHRAGSSEEPELLRHGYTSSAVRMRDYDEDTIAAYVETGEPLDKAGAYAVQGVGGKLVAQVQGCWNNVVGLPLCAIRAMLEGIDFPIKADPDWFGPCAGPYCHSEQ